MRRVPWITLALAGLACLVHASPALAPALEFNRVSINTRGELWRLFTGHGVHFGADHLTWDVAALLVLGWMSERDQRQTFCLTLAAAAFAISAGVWAWQPQLATYRGLSGLDSTLFGLVCARVIAEGKRAHHGFSIAVGGLALAGFLLKCGAELITGMTVFADNSAADYVPVPQAHLIGLSVGLACAAVERLDRSSPHGGGRSLGRAPDPAFAFPRRDDLRVVRVRPSPHGGGPSISP